MCTVTDLLMLVNGEGGGKREMEGRRGGEGEGGRGKEGDGREEGR